MPPDALRLEVIARQWWWEIRYPDYPGAVTANEMHVPAGRPVRVELRSADVIHSFWVPRLAGKTDVLPEQRNRAWFQADAAGTYRGQCAESCGAQHARMALVVIARSSEDFARWIERQRRPAAAPETAAQARGRAAFLEHQCAECHTVRGTPARSVLGPDLTHVAGRRSVGALTLPNTRTNLAAWIRDSQAIKPGNRMPALRWPDPEGGVLPWVCGCGANVSRAPRRPVCISVSSSSTLTPYPPPRAHAVCSNDHQNRSAVASSVKCSSACSVSERSAA